MEYNIRRMIEKFDDESRITPSILCKQKFPLISSIEKVHAHNLHVVDVCRQHSLHSMDSYEKSKSQVFNALIKNHQSHIQNALNLSQEKKKLLQDRNKSSEKRNYENVMKFQRLMERKKADVNAKEVKNMEKSRIRRQEFMKSLSNSFHKSEDKLKHIHQRSKQEMNRSYALFSEFKNKVEAANIRKGMYIEEVIDSVKERNSHVETAQQFWNKMNKTREEGYIKQLVSKFEKAQRNSAERNNKISKWVTDKKKEDFKTQEKYLKKRSNIQENYQKKRQYEERKSHERGQKAIQLKKNKLSAITNTLESKRKEKNKDKYNSTLSSIRNENQKIEFLNEKNRYSTKLLQAYRDEMEKLHSRNIAESYAAKYRQ